MTSGPDPKIGPQVYLGPIKTAFSNAPNSRILKFWILAMLILYYGAAITDREANFVELGHVETYSGY